MAREKLRSLGVGTDELTSGQLAYASAWDTAPDGDNPSVDVRAVVTDLDGTVVGEDGTVSEAMVAAPPPNSPPRESP